MPDNKPVFVPVTFDNIRLFDMAPGDIVAKSTDPIVYKLRRRSFKKMGVWLQPIATLHIGLREVKRVIPAR